MARNYREEERLRNERARALGFRSRAEQRGAIKRGEVPDVKTGKALGPAKPIYVKAGFSSPQAYRRARKEAGKWSDKHSRNIVSKYRPGSKHRSPEAFRAYYDAYVNNRTSVGSGEVDTDERMLGLRWYLMEYEGYDMAQVYDTPYTGTK